MFLVSSLGETTGVSLCGDAGCGCGSSQPAGLAFFALLFAIMTAASDATFSVLREPVLFSQRRGFACSHSLLVFYLCGW